MWNKIRGMYRRLYIEPSDIRIRIFNILATGGVITTFITSISNALTGEGLIAVLVDVLGFFFSAGIMIFAIKTQKYQICYLLTFAVIFLGLFSVLFIEGGGYKSGMPVFFIMGIVFTAYMLEGWLVYFFVIVEMLLYCGLCVFARLNPESINALPNEDSMVIDVCIGIVIVGTVLAITMNMQMNLFRKNQRQLEKAIEEATAANNAKSFFLANMSHEIRTPLNTILGLNELLSTLVSSDEAQDYLDEINRSGKTLLGIISDILDITKIESGHVDIIEGSYKIKEMMSDLGVIWSEMAEREGLNFLIEFDKDIPNSLYGSEQTLRHIINNLIGNAVKYTPEGYVRFKIGSRSIDADRYNDGKKRIRLIFVVEDTGPGISDEEVPKLFEMFERGKPVQGRYREGTGIGLTIVKSLTDAIGGDIRYDKRTDHGSIFTLEVDQVVESDEVIGEFNPMSAKREKNMKKKLMAPGLRVLMVDDNPGNLKLLRAILAPSMAQIDEVESGDEAIELLEVWHADIVLMDYMMPEKDGVETLKEIRDKHLADDTPFVAVTADVMGGTKEKLINEGFDMCISKPIMTEELFAAIKDLVGEDKAWITLLEDTVEDYSTIKADKGPILESYGIDIIQAIRVSQGSLSDARLRMELFARSYEKKSEVEEDIKNGNTESLRFFVHSLKSNARGIGAMELGNMCESMELRLYDEDYSKMAWPIIMFLWDKAYRGAASVLEDIK